MLLKYLSKFSSINVDPDWKADFEYDKCYQQKFALGDIIRLQGVVTEESGALPSFILQNLDTMDETTLPYTLYDNDDSQIVDVVLSSAITTPGNYRFYTVFGLTNSLISESFFSVYEPGSEELKDTILLRYTNDTNEFDYYFTPSEEEFLYSDLRVEGGFFRNEESYLNDTNYFRDQRYYERQLSSIPYKSKTLTIGSRAGVPAWVGEKINNILSLSEVIIDNTEYVRSEGSQVAGEPLGDLYPLSVYRVDLEEIEKRYLEEVPDYTQDLYSALQIDYLFTSTGSTNITPIIPVSEATCFWMNTETGDFDFDNIFTWPSGSNIQFNPPATGRRTLFISASSGVRIEGGLIAPSRTFMQGVRSWGDHLVRIGASAFENEGYITFTLPETTPLNVAFITGVDVFRGSLLSDIPEDVFANSPSIDSFANCFNGCTQLTVIPQGLFDNCVNVSSYNYVFNGCSQITYIPGGCLVSDIRCTADYAFANSGIRNINTLPFDKIPLCTSFAYCFQDCTSLSAIPAGLFANCPNVTSFSSCFVSCINLTSIPAALFTNNTSANTFAYCFSGTSITTIPTGLFSTCVSGVNFSRTFASCSQLLSIPNDIFINNINATNFSNCFQYCASLTTVSVNFPQSPVTTYSYCFYSCDSLRSVVGTQFNTTANTCLMSYIFADCTSLTEVSNSIFDGVGTAARDFQYVFRNAGLQNIPYELFANTPNVTNLTSSFAQTNITNIPPGLFDNLTALTTLNSCFSACLTLASVPENLITNCTALTNVNSLFSQCSALSTISGNFFANNTAITSFNSLFYQAGLTEIPENIFANNTAATSMTYVFYEITTITSIPNNLFANNKSVTGYNYCFYGCSNLTGTTPTGTDNIELWNRQGQPGYPNSINGIGCFTGCTRLTNWSVIPTTWGGGGQSIIVEPTEFSIDNNTDSIAMTIKSNGPFQIKKE